MIGLVYLVWAPLGPEPLRAFLRSYHAHPAQADHELVIVLNGAAHDTSTGASTKALSHDASANCDAKTPSREELLAELEHTRHRLIVLEQPLIDLAAYDEATKQLEHEWLCFVNSYSMILTDGWLRHLAHAVQLPGVGIAGASGSWESQAQWTRGEARTWLRQLSAIRSARRDYPRFPNPHIRTTAFMLRRQAALEAGLSEAGDKRAAYLLESGKSSITRRLKEQGQRALVVGRDGQTYEVGEWAQSGTYRSGDQHNLLVADRRTEDWQRASPRLRQQLSRDAWGDPNPAVPARAGWAAAIPADHPSTGEDPAIHDAAVVIVNYRTPELVERCLESVRVTAAELSLEAVVVDNASRDGSVERLRAALPSAKVVAMEENRGFAAGVNAGFRHSHAELVVVLNPDTEVRSGALQALLEHLRRNPRTGVVAPLLEDSQGHLAANGYRRFPGLFTLGLDLCLPLGYALSYAPSLHPYALSPAALQAGARPAHVCGAAMAIRRSAYAQAGPLDEGFFLYLEETEWQQRIAQQSWGIEVLPAARVCHLVRGGGDDALAPSPHFLAGALRYLRLRGVPMVASRTVLALALAASWATLCLIACLPGKRTTATRQARAYRSLLGQALR
ncbi:MAG TPA: glycosyltransferase family 2 protein [Solirubrobacteraceae bacterium]|jgi:GT2 family glycosyltransferase